MIIVKICIRLLSIPPFFLLISFISGESFLCNLGLLEALCHHGELLDLFLVPNIQLLLLCHLEGTLQNSMGFLKSCLILDRGATNLALDSYRHYVFIFR